MKTLICLLDKTHPPQHSFVDGMLAGALPRAHACRTILLTSAGAIGGKPARYLRAVSLPVLRPRSGLSRFANLPLAWLLVVRLSRRERLRGRTVTVLVRNEPVFLTAAALAKRGRYRLLFQQSYPHELADHMWVKRASARLMMWLSSAAVDGVLAVSSLGLARLRRYFGPQTPGLVVPLMAVPHELAPPGSVVHGPDGKRAVQFIYVGSHDPGRSLAVVLAGIYRAVSAGANAYFHFVGGTGSEIARLREEPAVRWLEDNQHCTFTGWESRANLVGRLSQYDVGMSLIPPTTLYREASPTKLGEYMGAGLAVLASHGIATQEEVVGESGGGVLAEWSAESIGDAIRHLCGSPETLRRMKQASVDYARRTFNYSAQAHRLWEFL